MALPKGKYGLQLPKAKHKSTTSLLKPVAAVFADNDDENSVEQEIARHAAKQKTLKDVEKQHKSALEQDPNAFDYDGVYDEMKKKEEEQFVQQKQKSRGESRYIPRLIAKAKAREREQELVYERQLQKERAKDDHLYSDKEKFITSAYKRKLEERRKLEEEERLEELKEQAEDVTKRADLSDFYRNLLSKNVAYGATTKEQQQQLQQQQQQQQQQQTQQEQQSQQQQEQQQQQQQQQQQEKQQQQQEQEQPKPVLEQQVETTAVDTEVTTQQKKEVSLEEAAAQKQAKEAAARERYLARKKSRVNL